MATVDYSSLTVPELKALLDERAMDYAGNAKKQELIDLLEGWWMNEQVFIDEYKARFRIFHSSEDIDIGKQLESGFADIKSIVGEFNPSEYDKGKELVYERTRYLRNESLEFFYENFQTMIMDASIDLVGEKLAD